MTNLHPNQKKILDFLLTKPEGSTLDELSKHLGVTNTATKGHLLRIEQLGYLTYRDSKGAVGRPRRRYLLSAQGHEAFPRQYSWLSTLMLEILAQDLGEKGISKLMLNLADKVSASLRPKFANSPSSLETLKRLTRILNDLGYRASLKQGDLRKGAIIEAYNCVYHTVAQEHPSLCRFDIRLIENVTGYSAQLEDCIARGGKSCRFCLRK